MTVPINSKLVDLLNLLEEAEQKSFRKWLQSPWATSNKKLILLYDALVKGVLNSTRKEWTKEQIFKKIYPSKPYNNRMLNNLLSELNKQLESFWAHQRLAGNELEKKRLLGQTYMERNQPDLFENIYESLIETIDEKERKSAVDFLRLNQLYQAMYYQPSAKHRYQPESTLLKQAKENLDYFYQLESFKYQHDEKIRERMLKEAEALKMRSGKKETPKELAAIRLYKIRLNRPENWSWKEYEAFKKCYLQNADYLPDELQKYFLFCCINDAVNLNRHKETAALKEMFDWYKFGLEKGFLLQHGQLTEVTFNNIFLLAEHLEEATFAADFLQQYAPKVVQNMQEDAQNWGKAELFYIRGEIEYCLDFLEEVKFSSDFFSTQAKGISIKASFLQLLKQPSNYQLFMSLIDNWEQYFRRHKFYSKSYKESYIRFGQMVRKLAALAINNYPSPKEVNNFKEAIGKKKLLFGQIWLEKNTKELFS